MSECPMFCRRSSSRTARRRERRPGRRRTGRTRACRGAPRRARGRGRLDRVERAALGDVVAAQEGAGAVAPPAVDGHRMHVDRAEVDVPQRPLGGDVGREAAQRADAEPDDRRGPGPGAAELDAHARRCASRASRSVVPGSTDATNASATWIARRWAADEAGRRLVGECRGLDRHHVVSVCVPASQPTSCCHRRRSPPTRGTRRQPVRSHVGRDGGRSSGAVPCRRRRAGRSPIGGDDRSPRPAP